MTRDPPPGKARRSVQAAVVGGWAWLLVPVIVLALAALHRRWLNEDAFINLRIVRNLLEGHGPVFNVGERVEAGTSPLWLLLLAGLGLLRVPLEQAAVWGGWVLGTGGLLLAELGALTLTGGVRSAPRWVVPAGAVVFAVLPPAWDYVASGLETGLCLAWLGATFWGLARLLVRGGSPAARIGVAVLGGLGPLVRPELALHGAGFTALVAADAWLDAPSRAGCRARRVLAVLGAAAALPLGYQVLRMGYYALPTPNTALAKEAWSVRWDQGLHYADNFFGLYWLVVPLAALLLVWVQSVRQRCRLGPRLSPMLLLTPPACALLHGLYVVRMGGDFMHGRMWLPVLFAWVMPVAALPVGRDAPRRQQVPAVVAAAVIAVWAVVCATTLRVPPDNEHGIGDERGWQSRVTGVANPVSLEDHRGFPFHAQARSLARLAARHCDGGQLPERAGEEVACSRQLYVLERLDRVQPRVSRHPLGGAAHPEVVAATGLGAIGVAGYLLGSAVHVVDVQGLADPIASRIRLQQRRRPGHEKWLPTVYLVARFTAPRAAEPARVTAARRALSCGDVAELQAAISAPLTWRRFVRNLALACRLARVRIARDPFRAEQELCGPDAVPFGRPGP